MGRTQRAPITIVGLSSAAITALASPAVGDVVFDTDLGCLRSWDGSAYQIESGRKTVVKTTASIANNTTEAGTVTMAKSYRLIKVSADRACRVRLFCSTTARDADLTRGIASRLVGNAGIVLDLVLTASVLTWNASPVIHGSDDDVVITNAIPIAITNRSGSTHTVAVTLTYFPLEV